MKADAFPTPCDLSINQRDVNVSKPVSGETWENITEFCLYKDGVKLVSAVMSALKPNNGAF